MSEWKEYKLGELGSFFGGVTSIKREDYGFGTPFITYKNIFKNSKVKTSELALMNVNEKDIKKKNCIYGDIFFTASSETPHEVAMSSVLLDHIPNLTFNGFCKRYRLFNFEVLLPEYARYLFRGEEFRNSAYEFANGDIRFNISQESLANISISLPDLPTQTAIAEILSSLDDKIELNNKINQELEALAQTLFKRWFVDFEFPNENGEPYKSSGGEMVDSELGEIPKGWRVATIDEVTEKVGMGPFGANIKVETFVEDGTPIISGQHLKGTLVEDNEFNFITVSHAQKLKNSLVSSGDVIFTHAGNIGQVAYLHSSSRYKEYIISQRQFYLRPNNEQASGLFLTLFFKSSIGQNKLLANTSSTGVPSISRPITYLRSVKVIISTIEIMNQFTDVVMSIYNDISNNFRENSSLSQLRDTLLPKLISGELEVS